MYCRVLYGIFHIQYILRGWNIRFKKKIYNKTVKHLGIKEKKKRNKENFENNNKQQTNFLYKDGGKKRTNTCTGGGES